MMRTARFRTWVPFAVAGIVTLPILSAQPSALLTGTVVDASGAVIVGAEVICRNSQTGLSYKTATSSDGLFRFPDIPIGAYELTVTHSGFDKLVRSGLTLLTGRSVDLRLQLQVGTEQRSISVTASAPVVQPTSSEVQVSIDSRNMRELPLNGRNPLQLLTLTAGAIDTRGQNGGSGNFQAANNQVSVNGNRGTDNTFELDGANYNDVHFGTAPVLPNPDALEEFTVKSSNFSASQAGAGASVQFATRSGTNAFHGSVFEFLRNDRLDARNFFATRATVFKRNQYGATFGGRIIKDRTFFFGSYQGTRVRGGASPTITNLPSAPLRRGDFAGFPRTLVDPRSGQPFPGNRIPADRMEPITQRVLELIPVPAQPAGIASIATRPRTDQDDEQISVRLDHNLTSRDRITGRFFRNNFDFQQASSALPDFYAIVKYRNRNVLVTETHTFSPNLLFVGSFGYTGVPRTSGGNPTVVSMQSLGANVPPAIQGLPPELRITITGYAAPFSGPLIDIQPSTYEVRARFNWNRGRHALQYGIDIQRTGEYALTPAQAQGGWSYNGSRTAATGVANSGDAFADFLLGLPFQFAQQGATPQDIRETRWLPWIQDDWRIHSRLTLNLGVRWEPWLPPIDDAAPQVGFIPGVQSVVAPDAPRGLVFSGDPGLRRSILREDWNNLAPRVGFAWDVAGSGTTVIRGAYGIFFRPVGLNIQRFSGNTATFRGLVVQIPNPPNSANPYQGYPGGNPFLTWKPPTSPDELKSFRFPRPTATSGLDPNTRTSYVQSWNFTVERQVRADLGVSAAYVGNHMIKGTSSTEGNPALFGPGATAANTNARRPLAGLASLQMVRALQFSNYHSLQIGVTKRTASGLNVLGNYVFSKCLDNNSSTFGGVSVINKLDPDKDYGRCDFDIAHIANISVLYDLPQIRSLGGIAGRVLNHWQVSSIFSIRGGPPFSVQSGRDNALTGPTTNSGVNDLADQITAQTARPAGSDRIQRWFNTAAYVQNAPGTFGNSGRNAMRAPGVFGWDFGLIKNIPVREQLRAEFRFEAFNFINHTNLGSPVNSLANPNFGRILTALPARNLQLALKVAF